ncbi:hypothetical protein RB653_006298 [Dictyostelium firmibasis]|uniref:Profilin n=1 Tax=Dictyostelium firmibasis TaxID=79012 RepID=A0AAN7U945_9MYCE
MSFLKRRKKKSTSTLTLNNINSNNSNIVCVHSNNSNNNNNNNNSNNNNCNNNGIIINNKKTKKLTSSTSCPNMLTTIKEEENDDNNNNNNSNINNLKDIIIIINWNKYTDKLIKQGFLETCVLDLNSGDLNSSSVGFTLGYQEWQEIYNLLQGSYYTTISCSKKRFYVVASNDFIISGRDPQNQSFILRKTKRKAIIGIFDTNKLQIDNAHKLINDLYYEIINDDKSEIYPVEQ